MNHRVAVNDFVLRQIEGSGKSFTDTLSFEEIADHADKQMASGFYKEGYRSGVRIIDVLLENEEQSTDFEWELIRCHALREGVDFMPMGPVTMMRNQLELPGGTKAKYSSEDWAKSIEFWQQYAALEPR